MHDTTTQTLVTWKSILSDPCYGLLYIQEPASTDYLQTVCNANSEANWGRCYGNSTDLQFIFKLQYNTTWQISALWLA